MRKHMTVALFGFLPLSIAACDEGALDQDAQTDGQYDVALAGKADGVQLTACHEAHILSLLNDPVTTAASLHALGVNTTAAKNLVSARATTTFATMQQVDAVPYVGPATFDQLRLAVDAQCTTPVPTDPNAPTTTISPECVLSKLLAWVNSPATTVDQMVAAGVAKRAATEVVNARTAGKVFASLKDLDAVPYVGDVALAAFQKAVEPQCVVSDGGSGDADVASHGIEVIFSPQLSTESHLARVAELIDDAKTSIDIAMYSFSDTTVRDAVGRAVKRGVSVRMVYDGANVDKGATSLGDTTSGKFEGLGVDVRYINKIMHHKFVLIDGPRTGVDAATHGILITGSGNWSSSAATRYDENTMFFEGHAALNLAFQEEFNTLWNNSRDFVWNAALAYFTSAPVSETMVPADPTAEAFFTSTNFRVYLASKTVPTFAVVAGNNTVADRLVALIQGAKTSIHIASAHIRSRPIAEALMAKKRSNPEVEIQIVLDGQEYVSDWAQNEQKKGLSDCLTAAGSSVAKVQACYDVGYKYGNDLDSTAGIELRYKWYAYRWDYSYAKQMHHKYTIVDGRWLATGSYNYSDNAEHGTMDNMVVLDGAAYPEVVTAFEKNFAGIFHLGEASGAYQAKLDEVQHGTQPFRITFDAMALSTAQITTLKRAMKAACKDIDSTWYQADPAKYQVCFR